MPSITREELGPEGQAAWDRIAATRGSVRGPFAVLLHHPLLGERVADVGELLRFKGVLPGASRELAIIVVARHMSAKVEWVAHAPLAIKEGASIEAVEAVRLERATSGLDPSEALVIDTARELIADHTLSDARYAQVEAAFGRQGVIELTVLVGYYSMLGYVLNTLQVPAANGVERPFDIATARPA